MSTTTATTVLTYTLHATVLQPWKNSMMFRRLGIAPPQGVLLYGITGVGKTTMALAVARATGLPVLVARAPDMISKVLGESEQNIRRMFDRARHSAPCVVLVDELNVLAPPRARGAECASAERTFDRILSTFLTEMDGIVHSSSSRAPSDSGPILVIATAPSVASLDPSIVRPGRLDLHMCITPPSTHSDRMDVIVRHALAHSPGSRVDVCALKLVAAQVVDDLIGTDAPPAPLLTPSLLIAAFGRHQFQQLREHLRGT